MKKRIQGQELIIEGNRAQTTIRKPFRQRDGLYVSLNSKLLNYVWKHGCKIIWVEVKDYGMYNIPLTWILKNGIKKKEVKRYPNHPMTFYWISLTKLNFDIGNGITSSIDSNKFINK